MAALLDRCGVACATTSTGTLTLGAALGAVAPNLCTFMDFPTAGAVDQQTYRYLILDSNGNWELGKGLYTASGTTLTRNVQFSSNANAAINLSGNEQVFISPLSEDIISISTDQTSLFTQTEKAQARANIAGSPIEALAGNVLNLNGGMEVAQANGASSVTLTATGSLNSTYLLDGVAASYRGSFVATAQQVTDAPVGFKNSLKFTVGTAEASIGASDELGVFIPVEGIRCTKLGYGAAGANALAIFFWTKVHRTGVYSASVRNGAKTRSYPFNFTVNAADTWEYKSVLISTGDTTGTWATDTTAGLYLNIAIAAGSSRVGTANAWAGADYSGVTSTTNGVAATSDVFQITGVGCLPLVSGVGVGDIPDSLHSPFLVRPFDVELMLNQRHYEKSYEYGTAPGTATTLGILGNGIAWDANGAGSGVGSIPFRVPKRTAPSILIWDGAGTSNVVSFCPGGTFSNGKGAASVVQASQTGVTINNGTGSGNTNGVPCFLHLVANARL